MMLRIYTLGRGGKHRDSDDARHWRNLSTHIARNIRDTYPLMLPGFELIHAEHETERVTVELNAFETAQTMGEFR